MQCAYDMLTCMACSALQYVSTLYHKGHIYEKPLLNIKGVYRVSLQRLSETFFILRWTERDMIITIGLNVKYPLFLSDFN
jgi:hypothetical protein